MWLYGFFNLVNLKKKTVIKYIRTGRTLKKLKKIIAISILGTLYSGVFLLCFFVGCYELYSISKDGVKVIETADYKLKAEYKDNDNEMIAINDDEIDKYLKNSKNYKMRYYISADELEFKIGKEEFTEARNNAGNIKIYYYNEPFWFIKIETNN